MMSTTETEHICGLRREDFQTTINGKKTDLYFLKNNRGNVVAITNYGGALVAIMVPDRNGVKANVIQGHDNIQDVINSPEPYLSTLIGRYGNRICQGKFQLHGKEYQLPINNGPNSLHGGKKGFNAKVWDARQMNEHSLVLEYTALMAKRASLAKLKLPLFIVLLMITNLLSIIWPLQIRKPSLTLQATVFSLCQVSLIQLQV